MVEQAVQFIETHYESIRTVREIAESIGVSYEALRKQFARSMGMPLQSFLAMVRVRKAHEWYGSTDKKLYAVARDVGFSDDAALRRQWKRYLGQCPRETRAQRRGIEDDAAIPSVLAGALPYRPAQSLRAGQ